MNKINYQTAMEKVIDGLGPGERPRLLLQSCCGPCSTYVLECLTEHFDVSVLYYNPNIYPKEEYDKRLFYQKKVIENIDGKMGVELIPSRYDPERFYQAVKGYEDMPEGGARCAVCFRLRLEETARIAKEKGFEFFTTTLTVSPHKNAQVINTIGMALEEKYGVRFLPSDFKKKEGYKRSIELSREYDLYRQNYCGCEFSLYQSAGTDGEI